MKKNRILLLPILGMLSVVCCFVSCGDDETTSTKSSVLSINRAEVLTRSSKDTFAQGDEIGIFVLGENGDKYNDCPCCWNNKVTLLDNVWNVEKNIYLNSKSGTLRAYFPYDAEVETPTQIQVESATQTDYLYSRAITVNAENPVVTLQMQHALALVRLVIKKNGYLGEGDVSGVSLQGINTEGMLDISSGEILISKTGNESYKGAFQLTDDPLTIGMIALPQTVTSTTVLLFIDGERYGYKLPEGIWEQGKETTYTLGINTVGKKLFELGNSSIDEWGTGGSYEGDLAPGIDIGTEL